jgi:hypothetical protein
MNFVDSVLAGFVANALFQAAIWIYGRCIVKL